MDIISFIYSLPNLVLFLIVFFITSLFSFLCLFLIKRFVSFQLRFDENLTIGYVGATIGVVYAILAGFVILYVMDNYNNAGEIINREAIAAAKIFRGAAKLPEPMQTTTQNAMRQYVNVVLTVEWPSLLKGESNTAGEKILNQLDATLNHYAPKHEHELLLTQSLFASIDNLYSSREERHEISKAALTEDLWILLIIASALTLLMNALLAVNFSMHIFLQLTVSLMVGATLFLILALDHPFLGKFSVQPTPFVAVLTDMNAAKK